MLPSTETLLAILNGSLLFIMWFAIWAPVVAVLEYCTHRWIMHKVNRWLDPKLVTLKGHGSHHHGVDDLEFIDMPVKNGLLLTSPFLAGVVLWGLLTGSFSSVIIPGLALLAWSPMYAYLWNRMHRGMHDLEKNWFMYLGPVHRYYLQHHLNHHVNPKSNYGTVFPWTDMFFGTGFERLAARANKNRPAKPRASAPATVTVAEPAPVTPVAAFETPTSA